jgi:leader peptidase (prepilin peptidase)/N-methyltransferase
VGNIFIDSIVLVAGLIVGSFLNVCIFRLPREGMSVVFPGSRCPRCLTPIKWYDNIPVLSFIILGGKCRCCKSPISLQYPIVEVLTSIIFFAVALSYQDYLKYLDKNGLALPYDPYSFLTGLAVYLYVSACLILVIFIDFEFRIIPDEITLPGILIAILAGFLLPSLHTGHMITSRISTPIAGLLTALSGAVVGGGLIFVAGVIGKLLAGQEAMGFGDVKFMTMLGGFLGMFDVMLIFVMSCVLGAVYGIFSWAITKDRYIAYGPFISIAGIIMIVFRRILYDVLGSYRAMLPI